MGNNGQVVEHDKKFYVVPLVITGYREVYAYIGGKNRKVYSTGDPVHPWTTDISKERLARHG